MQHFDYFRENIRAAMATRGVSLRELGQRLGTSHSYVAKVLGGDTVPSLDRCEQIANALEVPLAWLISRPQKNAAKSA